ncbi:MAG: ankyrin repeat domain-containing protein [Pirellula sp.]
MTSTNHSEECDFFDAVRCGRLDDVRRLAEANAELLQAYDDRSFGATPITTIAFTDSVDFDRDMIRLLIDLGADVNQRSNWRAGPWSPLHCAIHCGNDQLAEFLLSNGATLDVHTAAALGRIDELRKLLDEDSSRVHERGGDGCLPLHFAGAVEAAKLLLERGADIGARCVDHYSTAVEYRAHVRPEVVRFLFSQGAEADIFTATMAGDVDTVLELIGTDASVVHERVDQKKFPRAPEHHADNMLIFVLGKNATAMHAAARSNRPEMVDILSEAGADLNARGGYDDAAPLHIAAWHDHDPVAAKLIALGADINLRSGKIHNNSPAGWAIVAGSHRVFSRLLDHQAERHPWFDEDTQAAVDGEFLKYKKVPKQNYEKIRARLRLA